MKIDILFLLKPTEMVEFYGEKKIGRGKYRKKSPWIRTPRTPKNTIGAKRFHPENGEKRNRPIRSSLVPSLPDCFRRCIGDKSATNSYTITKKLQVPSGILT